jgi:CRP/FNR family cyclic AMP-dependent transcriptional regulator
MSTSQMLDILNEETFFNDFPKNYFPLIAECAELVVFKEGDFLMRENQNAESFYLLQKGLVSLRTNMTAQGSVPIETILAPAVLGWSWLVAPYKYHFDAVAVKDVTSIVVHTPSLLPKFEEDKAFGYEMYKRFMEVVINRLQNVRVQMVDIYAKPEQSRM